LVGANIVSTLLAGETFAAVQTVSRRQPKSTGTKLQATIEADTAQWVTRFKGLSPVPRTVFSALGTTRAQAGGLQNQWKIDHDMNVEIAKAAKEAGVTTFVFISSAGIDGLAASWMPYSKMKQGVEATIKSLDFDQAIIIRPGLIMGDREVPHTGAGFLHAVVYGLGRVSQGIQDNLGQDADVIGRAAVQAARVASEGKAPSKYWVVERDDIVRMGRTEWTN
jgi:nucleoside-diphosphate-sugar epimerase